MKQYESIKQNIIYNIQLHLYSFIFIYTFIKAKNLFNKKESKIYKYK